MTKQRRLLIVVAVCRLPLQGYCCCGLCRQLTKAQFCNFKRFELNFQFIVKKKVRMWCLISSNTDSFYKCFTHYTPTADSGICTPELPERHSQNKSHRHSVQENKGTVQSLR
jgi:hypothetical protein